MDLGQIYMASPDWIKGLMVVLPFVTLYATARLFRAGRGGQPASEPPVTKVRPLPVQPVRAAQLPLLQQVRDTDPAELDMIKQIEGLPME